MSTCTAPQHDEYSKCMTMTNVLAQAHSTTNPPSTTRGQKSERASFGSEGYNHVAFVFMNTFVFTLCTVTAVIPCQHSVFSPPPLVCRH